jgi:hypothetical protein
LHNLGILRGCGVGVTACGVGVTMAYDDLLRITIL